MSSATLAGELTPIMPSCDSPQLEAMHAFSVRTRIAAVVLVVFAVAACKHDKQTRVQDEPQYGWRNAEPVVAILDSGIRLSRKAGVDPRWPNYAPGTPSNSPYEIFALPGETVAFQVVVASGDKSLDEVTIDSTHFPNFGVAPKSSLDVFLVYEIPLERRSGGRHIHESLGWTAKSMPKAPSVPSTISDPLIPIQYAPRWAPYPCQLDAHSMQGFWIDLRIPEVGHFPTVQTGTLQIRSRERLLASIPLTVNVGSTRLPYASAKTMVYFDPREVLSRTGTADAVEGYLRLIHAHGVSSIFPVRSAADVRQFSGYLSGELFSEAHGYVGPGAMRPANVVAIGAYGTMGEPNAQSLATVDEIVVELERLALRDAPGICDIFLYAIDEQCDSRRGQRWRQALDGASAERLRRLRVGHTCSNSPEEQAVDLVMMAAAAYSPTHASKGRQAGKHVWIYNGSLPETGSFLTDAPTLSLTANGWIQSMYGIERWFYWESTFWSDDNRGGRGAYDPFATAETFHNGDGDHCNGDGLLVYPGRQLQFPNHDLGTADTIPSIRLKQWRRGIQDAGYIELARRFDPAATDRILQSIVRNALDSAHGSSQTPWRNEADALRQARKALFDIISQTRR